ncbi:hypothetical protein PsYK624_111590 [Phanerochaete sordida]|uniref:Uncharacterized protein n=1 Tax=Phanerochaete sordida TaxID=48140 RepID=A0A9P3GHB2_9APHY|nr:hypothetical protein PsYK624_111590 [Phanerochaete sordida]
MRRPTSGAKKAAPSLWGFSADTVLSPRLLDSFALPSTPDALLLYATLDFHQTARTNPRPTQYSRLYAQHTHTSSTSSIVALSWYS